MKKIFMLLCCLLVLSAAMAGCGSSKETSPTPAEKVTLTVSAAASLKDAAEEIKAIYAKEHPEINITYNLAASGPLQKQIEEGASVDLFISAGKSQMDALSDKDLLLAGSRKDLLSNELVLIAPKDSKLTGFDGLKEPGLKVSIGTPESVPAGKYAKETLTSLGLWDTLQSQSKLVQANDVRQVLTYVETGNVDAGLVYRSDAMMGKEIKVVAAAPDDSHKPIVYPMAVIKNSKHQKEAADFAAFLSGDQAAGVFEKYGFKIIGK